MFDTTQLSFGQRCDPENGLVECWFTHGALDEIKAMDLSDKVIWQFGCGLGDAWLSKRCKKLYCVERNEEWLSKSAAIIAANGISNVEYIYRPCNEGDAEKYNFYTEIPVDVDVIIDDDIMRYEVILKAVSMRRPLLLIIDNWQQDYVFLCPAAEVALSGVRQHIHEQFDHEDHSGNKWKTNIAFLE